MASKTERTFILAYGRFQPPSLGHELLVKTVLATAKTQSADQAIYLSHSQDAKKNPLSVQDRLTFLKAAFPAATFRAGSKTLFSIIPIVKAVNKGYDHLIMVGGSDRLSDFQTLLDRYNGQEYSFKSIKVISSGVRDPDAPRAAGMSGTKLRLAAAKNDLPLFSQGVPSSLSKADTKKMFQAVRDGLGLKKGQIVESLTLLEGVHDAGLFKAVFLAGGPGSGKDYILKHTLDGHGLVEINSDIALEFLMDKAGLDKKMPESEQAARNPVRSRAKSITELRQRLALQGRNGLIINGTGDDPKKIQKIKELLSDKGYESSMIFVHASNEVSKQRNIDRGKHGKREVPEAVRQEKWTASQAAQPAYETLFGSAYHRVNNDLDTKTSNPELVKQFHADLSMLWKHVSIFTQQEPTAPVANDWIKTELGQLADHPKHGDRLKSGQNKQDQEVVDLHSQAHQEALALGLTYYHFGRYGKGGATTHFVGPDGHLILKPKTRIPVAGGSSMSRPPKSPMTAESLEQRILNFLATSRVRKETPHASTHGPMRLVEKLQRPDSTDAPHAAQDASTTVTGTVDENFERLSGQTEATGGEDSIKKVEKKTFQDLSRFLNRHTDTEIS